MGDQQLNLYLRKEYIANEYKETMQPRFGYALPVSAIIELYQHYPYGHPFRVMTIIKALTGCRTKELDKMYMDNIVNGWFYFKLGKNQSQSRIIFLPDYALKELHYYRINYPTVGNKMFGLTALRYQKIFSETRKHLSKRWQKKTPTMKKNNLSMEEYDLQIKGIRATYATLLFYEMWEKYKDSGVAALMTCKEMKHSSMGITSYHYICNKDRVELEKHKGKPIWEILRSDIQTRL